MQLSRNEINLAARKLLRRGGLRVGLDVLPADYYSPILDPGTLPLEHWERPDPMPGVELDLDAQLAWLERELLPFVQELRVPVAPPADPLALHLDNPWYGPMDAHVAYAIVRHRPPGRVLELGSGFSTRFIEQALEENQARTGARATHTVVDPFPSPLLGGLEAVQVHAVSAAHAPAELFEGLEPGDVLFVDTSHVVKPGGEVIRLVLEILPTLQPGVVVHFHDIFRPFEYPRIFYERFNVHWQEQYLLQAFLAFNPQFEMICANHALWRLRRHRIQPMFEGLREGMQPSGFWFRSLRAVR